jgi:hypothetical protein
VVDLVAQGWSFRRIGDFLGVTRQRAYQIWCQATEPAEVVE